MYMSRKDIITVMKEILHLLSNGKEYSIKSISYEINSRWETTLKALEFLEEIGILKERKGKITYKQERLFSLKNRNN